METHAKSCHFKEYREHHPFPLRVLKIYSKIKKKEVYVIKRQRQNGRVNIKHNSACFLMATSVRNSNWVQITEVLFVAKANEWFILTHKVRRCAVIREPSLLSSSSAIWPQDPKWLLKSQLFHPRPRKEKRWWGKGKRSILLCFQKFHP